MRILVIDDSKTIHNFLKNYLKDYECDIQSVFNGQEGLEFLKKDSRFDLILLDWEMPVKSGPDTFDEIQKLSIQTPVCMMTSRNSMDDITLMVNKGVKEYLIKPFTQDILVSKIETVVGMLKRHAG